MARTPTILDAQVFTCRLPAADVAWLNRQGKAVGNTAVFLRQLVSDARGFFAMPDPIRDVLEADAKKRGKDQRDYLIELLTRRYEELLQEKFRAAGKK